MNLTAWHNNPDLKTRTIAALHEDQQHDRYIRGSYALLGVEWRGCHIGCLVMASARTTNHGALEQLVQDADSSSWHEKAEELYGIPRELAYLWDRTYENVPKDDAPAFAVTSVEAVPVGADLSLVVSHVMWDVLANPENGVRKHTEEGSRQRKAVDAVAALYGRRLAGDEPSRDDWLTARRSAYAAADAAYAAYAAAAADAAYAAAAAAADAAYAAAADAADAAYAAADAAARQGHFLWIGERIIHHTRNAPVAS